MQRHEELIAKDIISIKDRGGESKRFSPPLRIGTKIIHVLPVLAWLFSDCCVSPSIHCNDGRHFYKQGHSSISYVQLSFYERAPLDTDDARDGRHRHEDG